MEDEKDGGAAREEGGGGVTGGDGRVTMRLRKKVVTGVSPDGDFGDSFDADQNTDPT